MSNKGSSSFQGAAKVDTQVGANLPIARLQVSSSASGNLSRTVDFTEFRTYTLSDEGTDAPSYKFGALHGDLADLLQSLRPEPVATQATNGVSSLTATFQEVPKSICIRRWTAVVKGGSIPAGSVAETFDEGKGCQFVLNPSTILSGKTVLLTSPTGLRAGDNFALFFDVVH
jgi:hypothetical protein